MRKRTLANTDLELSAIGLGTWALGGDGYDCGLGAQDDKESLRTIRHCLDGGVNWIDTAPMYGLGHAEETIGKAVRGSRDRVIIATKCGILWDENGTFSFNLKEQSVRAECEASLRRLRTDYIDLYQVHVPTTLDELLEAWECIADLCREGKIRFAGVSNVTFEQLQMLQKVHPVASLQPAYNMFNRSIEDDILGYCQACDIGVISHSPLSTGLLSDGMTKERVRDLHFDDFRRNLPDFQEPLLTIHLKTIERLKALAEERGLTLVEMAIGWVLRRDEIAAAIVGARCADQVDAFAGYSRIKLDTDIIAIVDSILDRHQAEINNDTPDRPANRRKQERSCLSRLLR